MLITTLSEEESRCVTFIVAQTRASTRDVKIRGIGAVYMWKLLDWADCPAGLRTHNDDCWGVYERTHSRAHFRECSIVDSRFTSARELLVALYCAQVN